MNGLDRLLVLQKENDEAGALMRALRPRLEAIRNREIDGTAPQAITGFNLFQTPRPIARRMAQLIQERAGDGCRILEPSAGLGRLYEPLEDLRADWIMVEEAGECVSALRNAWKRVKEIKHADFLEQTADGLGGKFDLVVMNPPFKQGRDVRHIEHALEMVRDGGRLVSLCYDGIKQNDKIKPFATRWETLPAGSFREEGTGAEVALVVFDK